MFSQSRAAAQRPHRLSLQGTLHLGDLGGSREVTWEEDTWGVVTCGEDTWGGVYLGGGYLAGRSPGGRSPGGNLGGSLADDSIPR